MINTDYYYYVNDFKGISIPNESAFNSVIIEAIAYIDRITRGKASTLETIPDGVNNAVCAVAEIIYKDETANNVTSESVGNHSISYSAKNRNDIENNKIRKAKIYLARTGLLYGGMS